MSTLHVTQIKTYLHNQFDGCIDISDYDGKPESERESAFLTRALAAFALMHLGEVSPEEAGKAVTDGGGDNGIDAILFDQNKKFMYVVQSKWRHDGKGCVEKGEILKFTKGFRDLVNAKYDRFNRKIASREEEIQTALTDARLRIGIVLIYSGENPLNKELKGPLEDLLSEMNSPTELVSFRVLRQGDIHRTIAAGLQGQPINLEVVLTNWGHVGEPYQSYYGRVSARDVAKWHEDHFPKLFAPNLRMFLGATDVNDVIVETLRNSPEHFWYFNNGITALCQSIQKKPIGGSGRDQGIFECKGVSIVNGAQTVGTIASAFAHHPDAVEKAWVQVRFISLENCAEDFGTAVTRYTNTQNRIERRDFRALDPEQDRIRTELHLEGVSYVYKSGERSAKEPWFDAVEATLALAAANKDVTYAVQAKREIGKLWEDISKPPYKSLFNSSVSGVHLWNLVRLLRVVERTLKAEERKAEGRDRLIAVHGNLFIAWHVFQLMLKEERLSNKNDWKDEIAASAARKTEKAVADVLEINGKLYEDAYPASTFKNITRCRQIAMELGTPSAK